MNLKKLALSALSLLLIAGCSNNNVSDTTANQDTEQTEEKVPETPQEIAQANTTSPYNDPGLVVEEITPPDYASLTEDEINALTPEEILQIPAYVDGESLPAYDLGDPQFTIDELIKEPGTEIYGELDDLGRVTEAFAILGPETQPAEGEERGDISDIKPTGWIQHKYSTDLVDGGYLYNRSHLIGWQLSAENDNPNNLMTGTRYMNTQGMLPFENLVDDYIERTGNHVAYKVTPWFTGDNLLANGVQIQIKSIEDDELSENVYCYNVQPYVTIDYQDGENYTQ